MATLGTDVINPKKETNPTQSNPPSSTVESKEAHEHKKEQEHKKQQDAILFSIAMPKQATKPKISYKLHDTQIIKPLKSFQVDPIHNGVLNAPDPTPAQDNSIKKAKIGVLDWQALLTQSPQAEESGRKLEEMYRERKEEILKKQKDYEARKLNLETYGTVMYQAQIDLNVQALSELAAEIKVLDDTLRADYTESHKEELDKYINLVRAYLEEFAKKQDYDLILPQEAILYSSDNIMVTEQILALLKEENAKQEQEMKNVVEQSLVDADALDLATLEVVSQDSAMQFAAKLAAEGEDSAEVAVTPVAPTLATVTPPPLASISPADVSLMQFEVSVPTIAKRPRFICTMDGVELRFPLSMEQPGTKTQPLTFSYTSLKLAPKNVAVVVQNSSENPIISLGNIGIINTVNGEYPAHQATGNEVSTASQTNQAVAKTLSNHLKL